MTEGEINTVAKTTDQALVLFIYENYRNSPVSPELKTVLTGHVGF